MLAFIEDVRPVEASALSAVARESARAFFPGLVTARLFETWDFYTEHLGFTTMEEHDVYVRLAHPCGAQLALLREEIDGPPAQLVSATDGRGFWLTLEVDNVDAFHAELVAAGVAIAEPPADKPWGDRVCYVRDPNGVLIYLVQRRTGAA